MFEQLKKRKGQVTAIQYSLLFFLVVAFIMSMSTLFRRAVQGRIRDARHYMAEQVFQEWDSRGTYVGNRYYFYEPYYINQSAIRTTNSTVTRRQAPTLGIYSQTEFNAASTVDSISNQLAPKYAN